VPGRDPIGEEQDDAREETGFHDTKQETQDIEADWPLDEYESGRDDAPGHHDAGQPPFRPYPVQQQVAGDFEDGVADEEQPSAKGVRGHAYAEVGLEFLLGERDVTSVQERDHVHQQQERDKPSEDFLVRRLSQIEAPPGICGASGGGISHWIAP